MSGPSDYRRACAAVFAVYVCRLILAMAVVPPWQHGDEPQHVASVLAFVRPEEPEMEARIEADIIRSMYAHRFWEYYDRPTPDPLPVRFLPIASVERKAIEVTTYYYEAAGLLLRWIGPPDVEGQLHVLRALSAVLGVLTLVCCWMAARECLSDASALVASTVIALHPQFALVSVTATPDMVVNLCGAAIWWQGLVILSRPHAPASWGVIWAAAVAGAVVRTRGLLLLPIAAAVSWIAMVQRGRRAPRAWWLVLPAALAVAAGAVWFWAPQAFETLLAVGNRIVNEPPYQPRTWRFVRVFTQSLFDSAWLVAGWFKFEAPRAWLVGMHVLTLVAAAGTVRAYRRSVPARSVLRMAAAFVGILLAAIYVHHVGQMSGGALGRYFFPAAGPMSVLLWVGVRSWWDERHWPAVALGLVALLAAFDLVGWSFVLMPRYFTS